ncbi:MAG: hypothetical protein IJH04_11215 [Eggerthellaceae bacterium]|nr:hypothetical protein [Eggerthellaceae bacterium]
MRSLFPDEDYFAHLDEICEERPAIPKLASIALMREYPCLRAEEARAIYTDWLASKRAKQRL